MKYCAYCGKELMDAAVICPGCGCSTSTFPRPTDKRFCVFCGGELNPQAAVCLQCGCPANTASVPPMPPTYAQQPNYAPYPRKRSRPELVYTLAKRVKINAIIWLIIGFIQVFAGIVLVIEYEEATFVFPIIVGAFNVYASIKDSQFHTLLLDSPVGGEILERYEPVGGMIATFIYNVIFGGLIGVVGSIYYSLAIRGYVMEHREEFSQVTPDDSYRR